MNIMTVRDIDEERFFKIPKVLNEDDYYMNLPVVARYLYGVMLDRFKLSKSRGWVNDKGEVYFIFKQKELANLLNVSESSIKRSIAQLKEHQLIESESTITVNLYYISFPMPRTTGQIDLTLDDIDPTNSSNRPNNSETNIKETNKNDTERLHHTDSMTYALLNSLNQYSLVKFGKPIRKHDPNKYYDLDYLENSIEDLGYEPVFDELVKVYDNANLDYLQSVQERIK